MATDHERADHDRDLRKHDPLPLRLQPAPLTTAMDIVVLVKAMANHTEAAALVEQYAQMVASGARVDECRKTWDAALKRFEVQP